MKPTFFSVLVLEPRPLMGAHRGGNDLFLFLFILMPLHRQSRSYFVSRRLGAQRPEFQGHIQFLGVNDWSTHSLIRRIEDLMK